MITAENIQICEKENLPALVPSLESADIEKLVAWLSEKDDNFRYKCFLLLQGRSQEYNDVYPYWDIFIEKLGSDNSYQRSLGLMLIAENVRWDNSGKFDAIIDLYLSFCDDEKPVTVRQCIQSLCKIIPYKENCHSKIVDKLISIDLMQRKETQRKLLLLDIISVLSAIKNMQPDERIDRYIYEAMTGGILDNKSKKLIASL
jgi:hypothetical protein